MTYFPYYEELREAAGINNNFNNFNLGNFGLWLNKYIPLVSETKLKPCDIKGVEISNVDYYKEMSGEMFNNLGKQIEKKHINQIDFCKAMENIGFKTIALHSKLKTPLLTGIGESHPHEISMVFDHTLGMPYIPATGIKGVARLTFILNHILDNKEVSKEKDTISLKNIEGFLEAFGYSKNQDSQRGDVIFLDAYPLNIPKLKIDVMTPHYGDYYADEKNKIPPADNQNPNPIKFLTIKEETEFVFRVIVKNSNKDTIQKTFLKLLTENGMGAKTALGYGLFEIVNEGDAQCIENIVKKQLEEKKRQEEKQRLANMSEEEKLFLKMDTIPVDGLGEVYNQIINMENKEWQIKLASKLKQIWETNGRWKKKDCTKKQFLKVESIKNIIGEK